MLTGKNWQRCSTQTFWQEKAACSHVCQIYENDDALLSLLEGFVTDGLSHGEAIVLIASDDHLKALELQLENAAIDVADLKLQNRYLTYGTDELLPAFMVNDWPDYSRFMNCISGIIKLASENNRPVRVFGEMVAVLWEQGKPGATIMLEQLWNMYCEKEPVSLLCAYPKSGFADGVDVSVQNICKHHSKMISGINITNSELLYLDISKLN